MLEFLSDVFQDLYARLSGSLPSILTALALALAGWGLAVLLRWALTRFLAGLTQRMLAHTRHHARSVVESMDGVPRIAGSVVFWLTLAIFFSAAVEQLEFQIFSGMLASFAAYLPNVFLAFLVGIAGFGGGRAARHAISGAMHATGVAGSDIIGRLAEISIVIVALVVAADQVGIDSTLLMLVIGITLATTLGGMALAFGIGSGPVVSNLIASYYVRRMYRPGARIRVGNLEGQVVAIDSAAVTLDTADGAIHVPCRRFVEDTSLLLGDR